MKQVAQRCGRPHYASAMYLMFYLDEEGTRVYTLKVQTWNSCFQPRCSISIAAAVV